MFGHYVFDAPVNVHDEKNPEHPEDPRHNGGKEPTKLTNKIKLEAGFYIEQSEIRVYRDAMTIEITIESILYYPDKDGEKGNVISVISSDMLINPMSHELKDIKKREREKLESDAKVPIEQWKIAEAQRKEAERIEKARLKEEERKAKEEEDDRRKANEAAAAAAKKAKDDADKAKAAAEKAAEKAAADKAAAEKLLAEALAAAEKAAAEKAAADAAKAAADKAIADAAKAEAAAKAAADKLAADKAAADKAAAEKASDDAQSAADKAAADKAKADKAAADAKAAADKAAADKAHADAQADANSNGIPCCPACPEGNCEPCHADSVPCPEEPEEPEESADVSGDGETTTSNTPKLLGGIAVAGIILYMVRKKFKS